MNTTPTLQNLHCNKCGFSTSLLLWNQSITITITLPRLPLTFELELDEAMMKSYTKEVVVQIYPQPTDCSTQATKVVCSSTRERTGAIVRDKYRLLIIIYST